MVGVIIPLYKALDTIRDTLDSLVVQTKKDFITIPVVDGDNIDYSEIWEEYGNRGLNIKPIVLKENGGPGVARQAGIDAAAMCTYLIFCDADDLLLPQAVKTLSREIMVNNGDILKCNFIIEESNASNRIVDALKTPVQWMHGTIYRRQFLVDKNIRFLPNIRYCEDSYFNLVAHCCAEKDLRLEEPVYLWRENKNSITHTFGDSKNRFIQTFTQYIPGQLLAIQKILEIKGEMAIPSLCATIFNVYQYMQLSKFYDVDPHELDQYFEVLKNNEKFQKDITTPEFWVESQNIVRPCMQEDNNLIYFKQNFPDFIEEFLKK